MITLSFLQHYWWFIISLLGALFVFLMFVQGGQSLLYTLGRTADGRELIASALGRKWELTFTTLVTFGGAFFASFPLFYSTSFGGAYYVWFAILFVFVIQAVAYEYRRKPANLFGERTFNAFLLINGLLGPLLSGIAVGTFFTGANFTVDRSNMVSLGGDTIISRWTSPWHGLEAVADYRNVCLGVAVVLLSQLLALHFFINNIDDEDIRRRASRRSVPTALLFLCFFSVFVVSILLSTGYGYDPATGVVSAVKDKYLKNFIDMPAVAAVFLVGVAAVLCGIVLGAKRSRRAVWFSGAGSILAVLGLLLCAGWNDTCYYPSLSDPASSLTIADSSSSEFTLKAMGVVSLFIPVVVAYIWYVWRALTKPITVCDLDSDGH